MKKAILALTLLAGSLATAAAQDVKVIPAYWVVETNIKQKNFSIVRMYDDQHNLIHEVKMDGVYFNVSKVKHRKMLDQLLKGYYPVTAKKNEQSKKQGSLL